MFPEVAKQWSTRNFPLLPKNISYGSNKKVWWRGECGHEWQASPHSRTGKNSPGCPYCSGNRVLAGFNDLASRFPEIAAEWSEKNYPLRPDEVTAFSNKKAWWKGKCGHEWYALISSRSDGHGCPYCEDHKLLKGFNDFASQYPQLAKEWSEKNKVGADAVTPSKAGLFWWHCHPAEESTARGFHQELMAADAVLRWTSGRRKPEQPVKDPPGNSSRVELREERNNYTRSGFGLVKAGILVEKQLRS